MKLMHFADHLNSLLLIFSSFSFVCCCLILMSKECIWFINLLFLKGDSNTQTVQFLCILFYRIKENFARPTGSQIFKNFPTLLFICSSSFYKISSQKLEACNLTKNDFSEHLSPAASVISCIWNFVSNICIKYLTELNFREINFHMNLFWRMSILPYIAWVYFRGSRNKTNFVEKNFRENREIRKN